METTLPAAAPLGTANAQPHDIHVIRDELCVVEAVPVPRHSLEGKDILAAAGRPADADHIVLQVLKTGGLETIRLHEQANLALGTKFVLATGDRLYRFGVGEDSYEWPYRFISGQLIRELAAVPDNQQIEILRNGVAAVVLPAERIDLAEPGVENFAKVTKVWKLKVHGVIQEWDKPEVKVADALARGGYDPKSWDILLIVQGEKTKVTPDYVVDLRTPGIEKIRLMQRTVINGDGQTLAARRQFKVLADDEKFLDDLGLRWETVLEAERRWLLIHDYQLPVGYAPSVVTLALDIHRDYPVTQIDMFYFTPFVRRANGAEIPSTQVRAMIGGMEFQGWSRHRTEASKWDEHTDNVRSHMVLVDTCLAKELDE
ncbi:E2/UBC family protein [Acidovorax sp. BLS4]|uniref:E2/UBC family protein n=1 Tax=Acidovorax sp. BLS4 TaxID=3273430 RepID=UPI002941BCFF|nr:E2/UBC family protein [Paracidovorax avenae]WOI47868.1 E2/UBC family protein [Paracidovorax avenae]